MAKKPDREPEHDASADQASAAPAAADASVRSALLESRRDLLAFLRRRLGSQEEAEDVLQQFSIRALERASDLRDVRTVRGWLGRVLATTIVDHQRRATRRHRQEQSMDQQALDSIAIDPDPEVDKVVCDCLYKLLPTLRPDYSEVIWRADILGEPRDRIAISLGRTLNNINVRIHRARLALKKRLEEMCLTCPVHGFLDCRCDEAEALRKTRAESRQQGGKGPREAGTHRDEDNRDRTPS
jgi:RNA polymerase sigma-70 factor (ECF subfamily)